MKVDISKIWVSFKPYARIPKDRQKIYNRTLNLVLSQPYGKDRKTIDDIRRRCAVSYDDPTAADLKKTLPMWTPAGTYDGSFALESFKNPSGLACIDIDKKDNSTLGVEDLKALICAIPWVLYCGLSVRGQGVLVLVPIPSYRTNDQYKGYFRAICEQLHGIGIVTDPSACNINHARYLSYDDNAYLNENADTFTAWMPEVVKTPAPTPRPATATATRPVRYDLEDPRITRAKVECVISQAEQQGNVIVNTYNDWRKVGNALAREFGEGGRKYFIRLSAIWTAANGRQQYDPDQVFTACLNTRTDSIGYLLKAADTAGIRYNAEDWRKYL